MIRLNYTSLTFENIYRIVVLEKERESQHLEYKEKINFQDPKTRTELCKDISGMCNSNGGLILFGVRESDNAITGVIKDNNGNKIDDWLNHVLLSGVYPKPELLIKLIEIPNSDLCILAVLIPEAGSKTYFVRESNKCYVRRNASVIEADPEILKNLFNRENKNSNTANEILEERKLLRKDDDFGLNDLSTKTVYRGSKSNDFPIVIYSCLPLQIDHQIFRDIIKVSNWIINNSNGYYPYSDKSVYSFSRSPKISSDYFCFERAFNYDNKRFLASYFAIFKNGYIEFGISQEITYLNNNISLDMNRVVGHYMRMLGFSGRLYEAFGYTGPVLNLVSIRNLQNVYPDIFGHGFSLRSPEPCQSNKPFQYKKSLSPVLLSEELIIKEAQEMSSELHHFFGIMNDCVFLKGFDEYPFSLA